MTYSSNYAIEAVFVSKLWLKVSFKLVKLPFQSSRRQTVATMALFGSVMRSCLVRNSLAMVRDQQIYLYALNYKLIIHIVWWPG